MKNKDYFFSILEEFFEKFDSFFSAGKSFDCLDCYDCCTFRTKFPPLLFLEKDFIEKKIEKRNISLTSKDLEDFFLYGKEEVCPFYNRGCIIYSCRPIFCRSFGPVDTGTPLPEKCVYRKLKNPFSYENLKKFKREYHLLNIAYLRHMIKLSGEEEEKLDFIQEEASLLVRLNRYQEGQNLLFSILKSRKKATLYYDLAWTFVWTDEPLKSIEYFKTAIEKGVEKVKPSVYQDIAGSYLLVDNTERAEHFFNKSIEIMAGSVVSHMGLYFIYEKTGRRREAGRKKREILRAFPEHRGVEILRGR